MAVYTIRTFEEGDEGELSELSKKASQAHLGLAPKNPQEWRRALVDRPGMETDGVFIALEETQIVGYAAVDSAGKVCDFCVEDREDSLRIVKTLLARVEDFARGRGAERIVISVPAQAVRWTRYLERHGYSRWLKYAAGIPLDFPALLGACLEANLARRRRPPSGSLSIELLRKGPFRIPGTLEGLYVRVDGDDFEVQAGRREADAWVQTDFSTFTSLVFRERAIGRLLMIGGFHFAPKRRLYSSLVLLSMLRLPKDWYLSAGDQV